MPVKKIKPGPGQESVWDYPRPPRMELVTKTVKIMVDGQVLAQSQRSQRVLETSHPPVYYLPPDDIAMELLTATSKKTFCEWKGLAHYYNFEFDGNVIADVGWAYAQPTRGFESIQHYLAFYPSRVEACFVGDEQVQAQAGDFYGGWITKDIVGPFKGEPGTWGW